MADRYLLESGAPDGYQLEDGSGVLLADFFALSNTAEGQADGTVATTGNTGGGSGDAFGWISTTGTDTTFENDHPATGGMGYDIDPGASAVADMAWTDSNIPAGDKTGYTRVYFYLTDFGTQFVVWMLATGASAIIGKFHVNSTGTWTIQNTSQTIIGTSAAPLSLNTLYRVEMKVISHASAGVVEARVFAGHATSPIETLTGTSANTNGADIRWLQYFYTADASAGHAFVDDLNFNDWDYPGPSTSATDIAYTQASETDAAQGLAKQVGIAQASETDAAQGIAKRIGFTFAAEADTSQGFTQRRAIAQASETDSSQGLGKRLGLSFASESDLSGPIAITAIIPFTFASETDSAQGFAKRIGAALASEVDAAQGLSKQLGLAQALETDTAQGLALRLAFGPAVETDTSGAFSGTGGTPFTFATETDTARGFVLQRTIALATETDQAGSFGIRIGLGVASETDTAHIIASTPLGVPVLGAAAVFGSGASSAEVGVSASLAELGIGASLAESGVGASGADWGSGGGTA